MNQANFLKEGKRIVADFNIGGKRISEATLDYSGIDDGIIYLMGLKQIKTFCSTYHSQRAAELEKKGNRRTKERVGETI